MSHFFQLVKYKRMSESEWDESSLLPVQFATLIEPEKTEVADNIIEIRKLTLIFIFP